MTNQISFILTNHGGEEPARGGHPALHVIACEQWLCRTAPVVGDRVVIDIVKGERWLCVVDAREISIETIDLGPSRGDGHTCLSKVEAVRCVVRMIERR
jgi:hypothetical protein